MYSFSGFADGNFEKRISKQRYDTWDDQDVWKLHWQGIKDLSIIGFVAEKMTHTVGY